MHSPVMKKKTQKIMGILFRYLASPRSSTAVRFCYLPQKRVKRTMPSTLHEKALEYGTSSHFFLPVKLWCLCENEHRFKLTGWFYTYYHNIDYGRSQWWQAVGMATKFKCLCKFIKGLWIRSWEIQTREDLKQRGRGRQGDRDFLQGLMLSHPLDDT